MFGVLCALLAGMAWVRIGLAEPELVYSGDFEYYPQWADSSVVVTDPFELTGRASSVEVAVSTNVDNEWVYFNYALINQETGQVTEFGREVGYYQDSEIVWDEGRPRSTPFQEGSREDAVRVPTIPPGRYVLRIAPEGPVWVRYGVRVRRDVPGVEFFAVAFLLLLVPPVFASLSRAGPISIARMAPGRPVGP
ncbi:MAG TPA: hypothetical protein VF263_23685 [Longimicrobiaceae bacterium]